MLEFRGASAVIAAALLGILALIVGGLTLWWLPRRVPELREALPQWFWVSWALGLMILVGLLVYALFWFPSN